MLPDRDNDLASVLVGGQEVRRKDMHWCCLVREISHVFCRSGTGCRVYECQKSLHLIGGKSEPLHSIRQKVTSTSPRDCTLNSPRYYLVTEHTIHRITAMLVDKVHGVKQSERQEFQSLPLHHQFVRNITSGHIHDFVTGFISLIHADPERASRGCRTCSM